LHLQLLLVAGASMLPVDCTCTIHIFMSNAQIDRR
jgi:hypothetical protein